MSEVTLDYSIWTMQERQVWTVLSLKRGKSQAISQERLANITNKNTRAVRKVVESLIVNHRVVICSSYDKENGGYYLPETDAEIEETCRKLHSHALQILKRESVIQKITLAELLKKYQMEIPFNR